MLLDQLKKYKLDEIYVGMEVIAEQLHNIKGVYIILRDIELFQDDLGVGSWKGIIDVISEEQVSLTKHNCTIVYNDPFEDDDYELDEDGDLDSNEFNDYFSDLEGRSEDSN